MRFLLDENVDRRAAAALVQRGLDAVHAVDAGLAGASDVAVFEWAIRHERLLVTRDYRDFSYLAVALVRTRRSFPGILFLSPAVPQGDAGAIARAVDSWAAANPSPHAQVVAWCGLGE